MSLNRKQRRAEKNKSHDPAYMVRESDMRSHIDRLLKNDSLVQQAIKEEVRRQSLIEAKEQEEDIKALFLLAVHKSEGFGKKRLLRVARVLNEIMKIYGDRYEDCDRFAMRKHLKEVVGIDIERLDEEVEELATQESANNR